MPKKLIGLSVIEDNKDVDLPEEIKQLGLDSLRAIWQVCCRFLEEETHKLKALAEQREQELKEKLRESHQTIEHLTKENAALRVTIDTLEREKKALTSNLDRKTGELQNYQEQLNTVHEKFLVQEQEIRRSIEEIGRQKEIAEATQKRFDEAMRQMREDQHSLAEAREENTAHQRVRERLENHLKTVIDEVERIRERLKTEQTRAAVSEAVVEEIKGTVTKTELEIKNLKAEIRERRENIEAETRMRVEAERKTALLAAQLDAQERVQRDTVSKLEQELSVSRTELLNLRNRMVKAEGALEREKKAVERLETRLAVLAGGKASPNAMTVG